MTKIVGTTNITYGMLHMLIFKNKYSGWEFDFNQIFSKSTLNY